MSAQQHIHICVLKHTCVCTHVEARGGCLRGGCLLSCSTTLHFLPLRLGLSLSLELIWRPMRLGSLVSTAAVLGSDAFYMTSVDLNSQLRFFTLVPRRLLPTEPSPFKGFLTPLLRPLSLIPPNSKQDPLSPRNLPEQAPCWVLPAPHVM